MEQQASAGAEIELERMERGEVGCPAGIEEHHTDQTAREGVNCRIEGARPPESQPPISARERLIKAIPIVVNTLGFTNYADELAKRRKGRDEPKAGYPALAEFLGSDERWLICRRFSHLQARLILEKQEELRELEEELGARDSEDHMCISKLGEEVSMKLRTRGRRDEKEKEARQVFFSTLEAKYKEYAALLLAAHQLATYEKPADYERKNVKRFIFDNKPVVEREWEWIELKDDLITLRGERPHALLSRFLGTIITHIKQWRWLKVFKPVKGMQDWLTANAYTAEVADYSIKGFLLLLVPLLFVLPIYALSRLKAHIGKSIGVLVVFTLAFTLVLAIGTRASMHEALSCAAAYLAVLVVFLGSVGPPNGPHGGGI